MTRWLAVISSLIVFAHRVRGFVCSHYQVDDCINLASSEVILSIFGRIFTNSIYTLRLSLGRCRVIISAAARSERSLCQVMIWPIRISICEASLRFGPGRDGVFWRAANILSRSEEHTSELQSRQYLVCR